MKTKREIEYHSYNATPSLVAVIPAGTSVIPATNLPSRMGYWAKNWEGMDSRAESYEETEAAAREYVQANGQLIEFSGGVIVSSF